MHADIVKEKLEIQENYVIRSEENSMFISSLSEGYAIPGIPDVVYVLQERENVSKKRIELSNNFKKPIPQTVTHYEIDYITRELVNILEFLHPKIPTDRFLCNKTDDNLRVHAKNCFKKIALLKEGKKKKELEGIQKHLHDLSDVYFQQANLSEYHSYSSMSKLIAKTSEKTRKAFLIELQNLAELNESILQLRDPLILLLNALEAIKVQRETLDFNSQQKLASVINTILGLFQRIENMRQMNYQEFFSGTMKKSDAQSLMQTVESLYVNDLNKIEKSLNHLLESLNNLNFQVPGNLVRKEEPAAPSLASLRNKKISIFTCSYGTGHKITAGAIKETLEQAEARATVHDLTTGALLGRDRLRSISKLLGIDYRGHPLQSLDIFNAILQHQLYFLVNAKDRIDLSIREIFDISGKHGVASPAGLLKNTWSKAQIRELLLIESPDLVISTYHMDLNPILEVAEELGLPLVQVPTDYNMKFKEVFGKERPSYPYFKSLVPNYDIEETTETKDPLAKAQLIEGVGIPLRAEFHTSLTEEEAALYRIEHQIQQEEKVLYLSAGGLGQSLPHPELLANSSTWKTPLRIILIAGKNRAFVSELKKSLKADETNPFLLSGSNPYVTIEIMVNSDHTKIGTDDEFFIPAAELSKILDIADLSIAKAGGLSVAELLFKGVPILFDHRKTPFSWESFNIATAINKNRGRSNFKLKDLEKDLKKTLKISKNKTDHFYFPDSRTILTEKLRELLKKVDKDEEIAKRKGHLIHPSK